MVDVLQFTTKYQCDAVKKQAIIVAEAIAFYGCSVEQEDYAEIISFNRTHLECDKLVLDKLVQVANMERATDDHPSFAMLNQAMHKLPECGNGRSRKQECDALRRVYWNVQHDVYRMCIAPFPEIQGRCNWWTTVWILVAAIAAGAGCVALGPNLGLGVIQCVAGVLGVAGDAITCLCDIFEVTWCSS